MTNLAFLSIAVTGPTRVIRPRISVTPPRKFHTVEHHLYVDLPTVAQVTSSLIFLVCLFALVIWAISGFVMIHPFIAVITMIGCTGFYAMGMRTKQSGY